MHLSESHALPVPPNEAWAALNDVDTLRRVLPGCESLVEIARDEFVADMAVPLGLATSRFTVHILRGDIDAPRRCTLHFETRGGDAEGAGRAALRLVADGAGATMLHADITLGLPGILGVLGAPLVELVAHEMACQFFEGLRGLAAARRARGGAAPRASRAAP